MQHLLRLSLLATAGCLLLGEAGCSRRETPVEAGIRTQTLLVGNGAEPADLDPEAMSAFTDSNIAYALFEALTKLDAETAAAMPAAADRWEVSPDGLVYTFHIRPAARWSNGDPLTAEDFTYSFHRILSPAYAATYSYMLWPIKNAEAFNAGRIADFSRVGVDAPDRATLRITLERPTPYLPALAAHTTWLPVHRPTIERFGRMDEKGTKWTRPGNLVGNGAFTLAEWIPNGKVAVVKNPLYWNAARTRLNRIEFFPFEQPTVEELNFRSGQLHTTYALPTSKLAAYREHRPVDLRIDPVLSSFYLFINVTRPPLDNRKLRLALSHAVDREALAHDVMNGMYPAAHSMTPPGCGGYTARAQVSDDFAEARRLLAEAGYPGGRGLPVIEVQCYADDVKLRVMEAIQSMWLRELGVRITIAQIEQKTLFQNQQSLNYSIGFSGWIADLPDPVTFLGTLVTGNGNNWAGWSNREFDRLMAEAANTADNGRRLELFQRAEAIMLDEAPLIPLYFQQQVSAIHPAVRGWTTNLIGFHELEKVWLER